VVFGTYIDLHFKVLAVSLRMSHFVILINVSGTRSDIIFFNRYLSVCGLNLVHMIFIILFKNEKEVYKITSLPLCVCVCVCVPLNF
jgi:hypothetical protein